MQKRHIAHNMRTQHENTFTLQSWTYNITGLWLSLNNQNPLSICPVPTDHWLNDWWITTEEQSSYIERIGLSWGIVQRLAASTGSGGRGPSLTSSLDGDSRMCVIRFGVECCLCWNSASDGWCGDEHRLTESWATDGQSGLRETEP